MFIDETAAATNMERRHGRAELGRAHAERSSVGCTAEGPRGERCRIAVPHGHYKTTTVTAALRASGPFAIRRMDGAKTGACFLAYVTDTLVPALTLGDTVVLDNLACHKVAGVRKTIEAVGAHLLYLPAYSPDFNPIEMAFVKLKASCARQRPGPFRIYGPSSAMPSPASRRQNAGTISKRQATTLMIHPEWQRL